MKKHKHMAHTVTSTLAKGRNLSFSIHTILFFFFVLFVQLIPQNTFRAHTSTMYSYRILSRTSPLLLPLASMPDQCTPRLSNDLLNSLTTTAAAALIVFRDLPISVLSQLNVRVQEAAND